MYSNTHIHIYVYICEKKTQWTSMHPFPLNISRYKNYLLLLLWIFACKSFMCCHSPLLLFPHFCFTGCFFSRSFECMQRPFFFARYAFVCAQHVKAVSLNSPLSFFLFVYVEEEKNELSMCVSLRCKKEQFKPYKDKEGKKKTNIEYGFVCECEVCADSHDSLLDEQDAVLFFLWYLGFPGSGASVCAFFDSLPFSMAFGDPNREGE